MRINEFTQDKLSEAPKYKLNKDGTYTLIKEPDQPKTNKKFGDDFMNYLKGMPGAAVDNIKALGNLVTTGSASANSGEKNPKDSPRDGGNPGGSQTSSEKPMDSPRDGGNPGGSQKAAQQPPKKIVSTRPRTTYSSLAKASGIADPNKIQVGQKITLPGGGSYSVQSGDTLSGIAQKVRKGNIGGGGNDGTTTQPNLAPPKVTPKKDFGLGGLDVTGPVRRGDGKNSAVKDLPPVKNVKTFTTKSLKIPKVQPNVVPKNVSQGSTTAKKSVGDAGGFTGKFIDPKGNVAYTSPKAFAQNLLPGVFGTPKGQEIPSNLKRINPATKGAEKGTRFQQVDAPKPVNKDANFFSKEFDKIKSGFKTAVDTTKSNFAGDRKLGTGRFSGNNKPRYNAIENKDIKERYRDFSPTKSDAIGAQAAATFYKSKTAPNNDEVLDQKVIINKQLQDIVANKVKLAKNMSKTAGVKPNSSKLPKPLGANEPDNEFSGVPGTGNVKKGTGKTNTTKFSSNQRYNAIENKDIKNERH